MGGKGERHSKAKLSDSQVIEMRRLFDNGEKTQRELQYMFGISHPTAHNVVRRKFWKHLP